MKMDHNSRAKAANGPEFLRWPLPEGTRTLYTVVLHRAHRTFVQSPIDVTRLDLMEAIIVEAKKFGLTEEAAGGAKPITTRFSDKKLPDFFVDVSKINLQTRFYVTLKGNGSMLTIDAGGSNGAREKKKNEDEPDRPHPFRYDA